jgi:hypothetical protein
VVDEDRDAAAVVRATAAAQQCLQNLENIPGDEILVVEEPHDEIATTAPSDAQTETK